MTFELSKDSATPKIENSCTPATIPGDEQLAIRLIAGAVGGVPEPGKRAQAIPSSGANELDGEAG